MNSPDRPRVLSISPQAAHAAVESVDADGAEHLGRRAANGVLLMLALIVLAAVAVAAVIAIAHVRDRFWINIASATWVTLAWEALNGELYPPLRDADGHFAGTRYMPLHVVVHALLTRATGDLLLAGRIIGYASALGWFAGVCALARRARCPWIISLAFAATVLASPVGIQALCTIRSDGLALAVQLWALWIIARSDRPLPALLAGVLCALGFLAKLTAVWAAPAIALWLLSRNRASLMTFIVSGLIVAGGSVAAVHFVTEGRMLESFAAAGGAGWSGWGAVIAWSPARLLSFITSWTPSTWLLTPVAAAALLLAASRRDVSVTQLAWVACAAVMLVIYADIGVGENHVIELAAITAVAAAELWRRVALRATADDAQSWTVVHFALAFMLAWSIVATSLQHLVRDTKLAIAQLRSGEIAPQHDPNALNDVLAGKRIFSDDPLISVLRDEHPVLADAFVFRAFAETHPEWYEQVRSRLAAREFDLVVLTRPGDPDSWWYSELFLGRPIVQTMLEHYGLWESRAGYWIYRPLPPMPSSQPQAEPIDLDHSASSPSS